MILLGLGANLSGPFGNPENTLVAAMAKMQEQGIGLLKTSRIWLSAPVPASDQPWYRNAVIQIETADTPLSLLGKLKAIETDLGRTPSAVRNESRLIDLDILSYNALITKDKVELPHPRLHLRAFVLYPMREVCPHWRHPQTGRSIDEMLELLPPGQMLEPLSAVAA